MRLKHSHIILDACCVLNFSASGYFIEILKSIPAQVTISAMVKDKELLTLQRLDLNESSCEAVNQFEAAMQQQLLQVIEFETEDEQITFFNYAYEMGDDGESATGAIAFHREWAIATDDKRATSFLRKEAPKVQILSTLEIVKHWSENECVSSSELKNVLKNIRVKGRYMPHRTHPLLSWWNKSVKVN